MDIFIFVKTFIMALEAEVSAICEELIFIGRSVGTVTGNALSLLQGFMNNLFEFKFIVTGKTYFRKVLLYLHKLTPLRLFIMLLVLSVADLAFTCCHGSMDEFVLSHVRVAFCRKTGVYIFFLQRLLRISRPDYNNCGQ